MKIIKHALDYTTCELPAKSDIAEILSIPLIAADPVSAVYSNIHRDGNQLILGNRSFSPSSNFRLVVIALGKAAPAMLKGARCVLNDLLKQGVCISKHPVDIEERIIGIEYLVGNHPVPGEGSHAAGQAIRKAVSQLSDNDIVLLLLSGGGSALATLPVEGVSLSDMQQLTSSLLRSGASINELNAVRKHLDLIKGGGLLRLAKPARIVALVLSDVVGSPLDVIASGPAYPDSTTFDDAVTVMKKAEKFGTIPESIRTYLLDGAKGQKPETVKPDNRLAENGVNTIIGSNLDSCKAAVKRAKELGFYAELVTDKLTGEARQAGQYLAQVARERSDLPRPYALVFGGETTVTVTGDGKGGRNQEVALGAVTGMAGLQSSVLVTLATDGEDGPTHAAGAIVDGTTLERARRLGLDADNFLSNNDSYTFFNKTGDLLVIEPTGTNVNDISFIFGF
jgi:glycerate 2-kinase